MTDGLAFLVVKDRDVFMEGRLLHELGTRDRSASFPPSAECGSELYACCRGELLGQVRGVQVDGRVELQEVGLVRALDLPIEVR